VPAPIEGTAHLLRARGEGDLEDVQYMPANAPSRKNRHEGTIGDGTPGTVGCRRDAEPRVQSAAAATAASLAS
jgi:hypothetical protein